MKKIEKMKKNMLTAAMAALILLGGFTLKAQGPQVVILCDGKTVTLTANPTHGGDFPTYQWYLNGEPVPEATNQSYKFTPVDEDEVYCIITSTEECAEPTTGQSILHVFTVNPLPILTQPDNLVFCHDEFTTTINFTGTYLDATAVIWEVIDGDGTAIGMADNEGVGSIPAFEATNLNLDTAYVTIQVTPISTEGCTGTPTTFTIAVKPLLNVAFDFGTSLEYCQNESNVEELPTTAPNGITGTWNTPSISTEDHGIVVYTFTPDEGECISNDVPITVTVTVNPTLIPSVTIDVVIE